jgi:beta-ribofuranosylaminobenzene 5'-phosphate synthase
VKVYVKTPARLHLGLIDLNGDLGRIFGGLGVGINRPNVILEAQKSESLSVTGEKTETVKALVQRFLETCHIKANVSLNVKQTIPEHVGLGSGTQLALAVATALAKLFNVKASVKQLASAMGRGRRSGIGTAVFEQGKFVVDGGKTTNKILRAESFPPVIFRQPFPEDWSFVVVIPNVEKGLAKDAEAAAFERLPLMRVEDVGRICRLTMMKLLPSLVERDIEDFGGALTQIQIIVGEHFAGVQGGRYSSLTATEGIALLKKLDAYGVGQSSWGPAFYGLFQKEKAKEIQLKTQVFLNESVGGRVFIAKANNRGAYIKVAKK